jgi:hypothetical protein
VLSACAARLRDERMRMERVKIHFNGFDIVMLLYRLLMI